MTPPLPVTQVGDPTRGRLRQGVAIALFLASLLPSAYMAIKYRDMPQLGLRHDDTIYWICAKSLAEGTGYRLLSLPGQPHQAKYPPLYSWLLSWVWKLNPSFPQNLRLATLFAWLPVPAYLLLARRWFLSAGAGSIHASVLILVLATNPYVLQYSVLLMTETLFTALLLAALILAERAGARESAWWQALATGLAGAGAYLTRTAALPLLVIVPLWFLSRKLPARAALFCGGMLPAVAGWTLWVRAHMVPHADLVSLYYTNYIGFHFFSFSLGDLPLLVSENLSGMAISTGRLFLFAATDYAWGLVFWGILILGCAAGFVRLARRRGMTLYHWFAIAYLALLAVWHLTAEDEYERLLLPLLPLLLMGLSLELVEVFRFLRRQVLSAALWRTAAGCLLSVPPAAFLLLIIVTTAAASSQYSGLLEKARAELAAVQPEYGWIREHVPEEAIVLSPHDMLTFLYTGRQGMLLLIPPKLLYTRDRQETFKWVHSIVDYAKRYRASYIVMRAAEDEHEPGLTDTSREVFVREAYRSLARRLPHDPRLRLVYQSAHSRIYEVVG